MATKRPHKQPVKGTSEHEGGKSGKRIIPAAACIVLIAGIALGIIFIARENARRRVEAEMFEKSRIDSLRNAELAGIESLRLDSIRQDSLTRDSLRRSFRSPDLSFFDLKGPVKKCVISSTREISYIENPILEFDREGVWVNDGWKEDRKIVREEYPEDLHSKIVRNDKGYIVKQKYLGDFEEMCAEDYVWKQDRIAEGRNSANPDFRTLYRYDGDEVVGLYKEDSSEEFKKIEIDQKFTYVDFDDMGNWTKRKVKEEIKGREWNSRKPHRESNDYYEVRTITYWEEEN